MYTVITVHGNNITDKVLDHSMHNYIVIDVCSGLCSEHATPAAALLVDIQITQAGTNRFASFVFVIDTTYSVEEDSYCTVHDGGEEEGSLGPDVNSRQISATRQHLVYWP